MTPQMIMTMIVLGFAVFLIISDWVRVDVVGIMMMILLPLVGLVVALSASNTFLLPTHQVTMPWSCGRAAIALWTMPRRSQL